MASAAIIVTLPACSDKGVERSQNVFGGTVVIAATSDPDAIFPPLSGNLSAREVTELIYNYLADIGPELNVVGDHGFKPSLADSWTWSADSLSIAFHINPRAKWHDGAPVRARDVVFTHEVYTSPALGYPMGDDLRNIDSVTAKDSLAAVFWFHRRTSDQFYTAANLMLILPKHVYEKIPGDSLRERATREKPVGSGQFRFVSWTQGVSLELAADTANFRGRPGLDRVIWTMTPDYAAALAKLSGGEADVFDVLHAENAGEVAANPRLRVATQPGMDYAFLQFNLRDPNNLQSPHPIFANRELRRALTMALDREAMVKNVFDTLGAVSIGPTIRALPTTSATLRQIPYDTARAAAILDSLGWTGRTRDGIRARDGKELAFTMITPASSSARNRMAVLVQSQLKRLGVRANIEKMEFQAFETRQSARTFDATFGAWHVVANPSAVREGWTTEASRKKDGRNYGSYENPVFDAAVDSAGNARDSVTSSRYYNRAYQAIIDDAPAIWLYEPKTVLGLDRRITTSGMVTGAWWAGLPTWTITPSLRIRRDQSGGSK